MGNLKIAGVSVGLLALVFAAGWFGYLVGLKQNGADYGELWKYQYVYKPAWYAPSNSEPIGETGSMYPCISWGTRITYSSVNGTDLSVGDIISYKAYVGGRGSSTVTHRVIQADGCIRTKGDALQAPDSWCLPLNMSYDKAIAIYP